MNKYKLLGSKCSLEDYPGGYLICRNQHMCAVQVQNGGFGETHIFDMLGDFRQAIQNTLQK